jgi:hypothetical protein
MPAKKPEVTEELVEEVLNEDVAAKAEAEQVEAEEAVVEEAVEEEIKSISLRDVDPKKFYRCELITKHFIQDAVRLPGTKLRVKGGKISRHMKILEEL